MSDLSIAAVILTKNEEINIERCLDSVSWCHERVVIDSGSVDRTREFARSRGARVLVQVQGKPFNIAEQRNWALAQAGLQSAWVLFLDADEECTPALRQAISRAIEQSGDGFNAYELTPRYLFWGVWLKRTQGFPNWHARLLRRGQLGFAGGVWEHFDARAKAGRIPEPYNHYANSKGLSDWLERHDRYSTWDAERTVAFIDSRDTGTLGTERKVGLRVLAARWWPLRPWAGFFYRYVLRRGFLEGASALVFCLLHFFYDWMTVIKIVEIRRRAKGEPF